MLLRLTWSVKGVKFERKLLLMSGSNVCQGIFQPNPSIKGLSMSLSVNIGSDSGIRPKVFVISGQCQHVKQCPCLWFLKGMRRSRDGM